MRVYTPTAMVRPSIGLPTAGYPVAVERIYAVALLTPLNALLAIVGLFAKKYTLRRALAPKNAESPMDVTPAGMVIAVRALAPENALAPMDMSLLPAAKVTDARLLASKNALAPMDVTPAGMVMAVRALVLSNALAPMDVSLLPAAKVTLASLFAR